MMTEQQHATGEVTKRSALQQSLQASHPLFKELLAGGVAGGFAKSAVAPLERVKIIIQTSQTTRAAAAPRIGAILRDIVRSEGSKGLWKGNGASVLRVVPYAALHFSAYERYRTCLLQWGEGSFLGQSPVVDLFAGSMAGATAVIATYPLDLLRTRLAWRTSAINIKNNKNSSHRNRNTNRNLNLNPQAQPRAAMQRGTCSASMYSVLNTLARREGVSGLYKGVGPTLLGIFPYAGLKFFVYQYLKGLYISKQKKKERKTERERGGDVDVTQMHIGTHMKLCFGACAGLIAQTVTYPLDVVRRRMQVQDLLAKGAKKGSELEWKGKGNGLGQAQALDIHIKNSWHGLRTIYATMGVRKGLYAGLSLNYLKVVPSTAIGFAVYDSAKEYLNHKTSI